MVFEGILVDVLNRFLGPYVKNLDASQLRVGIWGGDVLLEKLELKENALADLDLPIRVFGGYLEKLRLKIPWKNLYTAPVIADVDGVYILVGPATASKYNADKEAKELKEAKEKQLKRIEEARKKAAEPKEKKEEAAPGFVDKLVTQIVKNVQITVKNIHVRYEDAITNPSSPFSFGVTLDSLFVQSTDSNYDIGGTETDPTSLLIYKLVQMNCLAVYWNSQAMLFGVNPPDNWTDLLKDGIARPTSTPSDVQYVVHPISAEAKLRLITKPGRNPDIPQALVQLVMGEVAVALGKQQYCDIMRLVESLDRMSINRKYLKYKSESLVGNDLRGWWRYAIAAVLEEDVKRRSRMWSWKHIKQHRELCKAYTDAYTKKLVAKSISAALKSQLEELEDKLDVFNITVCRQRAENKAQLQLKERKQKEADSGGGWWAWATGWGGGGGDPSATEEEEAKSKPPSEEELAKEREKLYEAIGYRMDGQVPVYPVEYVAHELHFELRKVSLRLWEKDDRTIAHVVTQDVHASVLHRPTSRNISVETSIHTLEMTGVPNGEQEGEEAPEIVSRKYHKSAGKENPLLHVQFDLHPLGSNAEQRIRATLLPVQVTYDAGTIDTIIGMFLLPKDVQLQKLSAAAASTLEDLKTQTRAGLEHAISKRKLLDVNITLHSPYVVVPENGTMGSSSSVLVADLGQLKITSDMKHNIPSVREATMAELEEAFYDQFKLELTHVQVIVAAAGEDWVSAVAASSPLHLLEPTGVNLLLKKSLLPNDTRLPNVKVSGKLPKLTLSLSDKKVKQVLQLVQSIPIPPPSLASKPEEPKYSYTGLDEPKSLNTEGIVGSLKGGVMVGEEEEGGVESDGLEYFTASEGECDENGVIRPSSSHEAPKKEEEVASTTKLQLQFEIDEININFSEHNESANKDTLLLDLAIVSVETTVVMSTWQLGVGATIGNATIRDHYSRDPVGGPEMLLEVERSEGNKFLSVHYAKYERTAPQYTTTFQTTKQHIDAHMAHVRLKLDEDTTVKLMDIGKSIASVLKTKDRVSEDLETVEEFEKSTSKDNQDTSSLPLGGLDKLPGERDLHVITMLEGVQVTLGNVLTANITGLKADVGIYEERTEVNASMADVTVTDRDHDSSHPKVICKEDQSKKIISTVVTIYKGATRDGGYTDLEAADLSVNATVQRVRVVVVFKFLNRVKDFATRLVAHLKLDQETIDSAREAAARTASRTAEALKEQSSSRLHLAVTIHAPLLLIPLSATSQSALVANLGQLDVHNKFLLASDPEVGGTRPGVPANAFLSSAGLPAIVDCMHVCISSICLERTTNLKDYESVPDGGEYVILKPLEFRGHVTRRLSDWCTVIPAVDVSAELEAVDVSFSPEDFQTVMSVVDSINDGKKEPETVSPDVDRPKDEQEKEGESTKPTEEAEGMEVSNIHVKAGIREVKVTLHSVGSGKLAEVRVKGVSADVDLPGSDIHVKAEVTDIEVTDLSANALYSKIVSVAEGAKALETEVTLYTKATKGDGYMDMSKCDLSVDARVGQLRVVALFLFINRLLTYFKKFDFSKKAIESAKKSAQESATAAMSAVQELHQNGQRMKLNVAINGPEVTIPVSSESREVVVAYLGFLQLSNSFHLVKGGADGASTTPESAGKQQQQQPIFEKYEVELKDLQVYRSISSHKSKDGQPRCLVLEPFNLTVWMKRNLSTVWFNDIPTIDITAKLGTLKMIASDSDIELVCGVLEGNLQEGRLGVEEEEESSKEDDEKEGGKEEEEVEETPDEGAGGKVGEKMKTGGEEKTYLTLNMSAELPSIGIELYRRDKATTQTDASTWQRDPQNALAKLTLQFLVAKTSIWNNGAIMAGVTMDNCLMDDCRPEKEGKITRLVERSLNTDSAHDSAPQPLISVEYNMSQWRDMNVAADVQGVEVLVDLKFILTLVNFITSSLEPLTKKSKKVELEPDYEDVGTGRKERPDSRTKPTSGSRSLSKSSKTQSPSTKVEAPKINVKAKVSRPCIALLENAEEPNSRALVLGADLEFALVIAHGQMNVATTIGNLSVASATYKSLHTPITKVLSPIPKPITATLNSLEGPRTIITVGIPSLSLTLSPTTVRLILHVVQSLQPDKAEEEETGVTSPYDLWTSKPLERQKWYLQPPIEVKDEGTSVDAPEGSKEESLRREEQLTLSLEQLSVVVEQEHLTGRTSPAIAITMGKYGSKAITMIVQDWSGKLSAAASLSLEASYYNLGHDAWEPLLEPVADPLHEGIYRSWTLTAEVEKLLLVEENQQIDLSPELAIKISSQDRLQLTATKTSIGLFKELLTTYMEKGVFEEVDLAAETFEAAYLITNRLGSNYPVLVKPKNGLKVHGAYSNTVRPGASVPLHPVDGPIRVKPGELLPRDAYLKRVHILQLEIRGFHPVDVALGTSEKVLYPLWSSQLAKKEGRGGKGDPQFGLVVEIERRAAGGTPKVTLRSPLQINNHLEDPIAVYWSDVPSHLTLPSSRLTTVEAGAIKPLPLDSAHKGFLFLQPRTEGAYALSEQALSWKDTQSVDVACSAEEREDYSSTKSKTFFIHAQFQTDEYSKKPSFPLNSLPHHTLLLHYPLIIHNLLPSPFSMGKDKDTLVEIQPGQEAHFQHTNLSKELTFQARLNDGGKIWSGDVTLGPTKNEHSSFKLSAPDDDSSMELTVQKEDKGTWHISIYSPYWMINKTGMTLEYKGNWFSSVVTHPSNKTIAFFPLEAAKVRIVKDGEESEWSNIFSLDALGSEGIFSCKFDSSQQEYQMGSKVRLSRFALTKIITISPFYLLYNRTKDCISLLEQGLEQQSVMAIPPKQLLPFWPQTTTEKVSLTVNDPTIAHSSMPFKFTETSSLLIRTQNTEIPAVEVEIQVTGSANILTFNPYYRGCVPIQLVNDTDCILQFSQDTKSVQTTYLLTPGQSLMYTWDDPMGSREILWNIMQQKKSSEKYRISIKDDNGEFPIPRRSFSSAELIPASSLPTEPRLPSITEDGGKDGEGGEDEVDMGMMEEGEKPKGGDWEMIEEDMEEAVVEGNDQPDGGFNILKMASNAKKKLRSWTRGSVAEKRGRMGYWVSFLDGLQHVVLFTENKAVRDHVLCGNRTERPHLELTLSLIGMGLSLVDDVKGLEIAYLGLPQSDTIWEEQKRLRHWKAVSNELKNQLEVLYNQNTNKKGEVEIPDTDYKFNFSSMELVSKNGSVKKLRRSHFEGVYAQVSLSKHLTAIEARINEFQVDNQLPFALNPTILYAFPTPPSVASKYAPKPFVEASLIIRNTEQSSVNSIEYLQVLVQEMGVKVDLSFIMAITSLFADLPSRATEPERFEKDIADTELPLTKSKVAQVSAASTRNYFKYLHLSPLDIHLSFSLEEKGYEKDLDNATKRNPLLGLIITVIRQFAIIIGRTKDAELKLGYFQLENTALTQNALVDRITKHYIQQAAIQMYSIVLGLEVLGNPVGFIKGLKDGAIGLFYQPIQGAVLGPGEFFEGLSLGGRQFVGGTLGGLSGAAGKITGVLGDTVAKLTFDEDFQGKRQTGSIGQGLEGAAKGLLEGFTGVITQPVKGAKKGGVWGFMKGTGKGVLGLVLRPTGGLIDLTSATLTAVQKKTRVGDIDVPQTRSARYIGPEKIVEPYSPHKAEGYALFLAFDNGRLVDTDIYFDHLELVENPLKVLLITNNRFLVIKRHEIFDKWSDDWEITFQEICGLLSVKENVISIPVMEEESTLPGLGFLSPKKRSVKSSKSLKLRTPELAKKATGLIDQACQEYSTTETQANN